MTHYFFDSSALIKRYINEAGTDWVRSIVTPPAGHIVLIARITPVEMVSGAMRRKRDGLIDLRTAHAVRAVIDRHVMSIM